MLINFKSILLLPLTLCCFAAHLKASDESNAPTAILTTNQVAAASTVQTNDASASQLQRPAGLSDEEWKFMHYAWIDTIQRNQPMEFYIRVLDQNDQPVSQATLAADMSAINPETLKSETFVRLYRNHDSSQDFTNESLTLYSDNQGWIRFNNRQGKSLHLQGITKAGYISQPPEIASEALFFEPDGKRVGGAKARKIVNFNDIWNSNKGLIFHLWKKGETERLIQWRKKYLITRSKPEAQPISLFSATNGQTGYPDLIFKTSYAHPEILEGDRHYDRWLVLEAAPGVALTETAMEYPYAAPADGYTEREFKFLYRPDAPPTEHEWTRKFYVRARDGNAYAALTLVFDLTGDFGLKFNATVNPSGSRNLEPDPAKLITDPEEIRRLDEATRPK